MATLPLLSVQAIISQPPGVYETLRCVLLPLSVASLFAVVQGSFGHRASLVKRGFAGGGSSGARAVCACVCMRVHLYLRNPQELT